MTNVCVQTFDSYSGTVTPLVWTDETCSVTVNFDSVVLNAASQYGGAGGTGKYPSPGAVTGSATTIATFSTPSAYFGLWWSAGDASNFLTFYKSGVALFKFTSSVMSTLPATYKGNPNTAFLGQDANEGFAYINFFMQVGSFDQVKIQGGGFESDNWAIRVPAYGAIAGDAGVLPGTPIAQYVYDTVSGTSSSQTTNIDVTVPARCVAPVISDYANLNQTLLSVGSSSASP